MSFPAGNLLVLSLAPILAGCTGVNVLLVFSFLELGNYRAGKDSSGNSNFVFSSPYIGENAVIFHKTTINFSGNVI